MKKRHINLCALFSCILLPLYASSDLAENATHQASSESRDAKTSRILAGVGRVVEGLIKVIKDPHNKQNVLLHVGDMLSGIFSIAASSLPSHELTQEEVAELRSLLQDVAQSVVPLLQHDLTESAASLREYLQTVPLEHLNEIPLNESSSIDSSNNPSIDDNEVELHTSLLNALHNLIQNLFAIVQYPEDTRVMEQSIADMFSNIINVASKTLKYEYLSSKDAEETIVNYLDSFSDELTKEIKHLMLQTALHLRGSRACGSCNNCCSSSCSSSSCCSTICRPCCKPCNNCCRNITTDDQVRSCCSCSSCNCNSTNRGCCNCCSSCSSSCKSGDSEVNRKCSSCGCSTNNCTCTNRAEDSVRKCSSCGCSTNNCNSCSNCGNKTVAVDTQNPSLRSCNSCGNSSGSNCKNCDCKNTMRQQVSLRKCTSCNCTTNNGTCNTCGCKTVPIKTFLKYTKSGNNYLESASENYLKCGCSKPKPQQQVTRNENICSKCGCSNKPNRPDQARCGCNKPKPQQSTTRDLKCGCSKPKPQQGAIRTAKCNCNKPKPQQQITRNKDICSKCGCSNKPNRPGEEARCGCYNNNKPKTEQ